MQRPQAGAERGSVWGAKRGVVAGQRDTPKGEAGEAPGMFRSLEAGRGTGSLQRTTQPSLQARRGSGWSRVITYQALEVIQARGDGDSDEG